jgi:hypothetical protein
MMNNPTGDRLTESSADSDCRTDCSKGRAKSTIDARITRESSSYSQKPL